MKWRGLMSIYLIVGVFLIVYGFGVKQNSVVKTVYKQQDVKDSYYRPYYDMCEEFFKENFLGERGLVVSQVSQEEVVNIPYQIKPYEQVLYLEYLLYGEERYFEEFLDEILDDMDNQKNYIALVNGEDVDQVDLILNLELIDVLDRAYRKWGNVRYKEIIYNIEEGVYGEYFRDDEWGGEKISVSALNLYAMRSLLEYDQDWITVYLDSEVIVKGAYIGGELPLYQEIYYFEQEDYDEASSIYMLDSLQTVLNLVKVELYEQETIEWLKEELKKGNIYERYDVRTGEPESYRENVQIYAVIARIAKYIDDLELYVLALEKMLRFQETSEGAFCRGAFISGDYKVNAGDNLQALLAF